MNRFHIGLMIVAMALNAWAVTPRSETARLLFPTNMMNAKSNISAVFAQEPIVLELDKAQTAVLDPVRWEKTIPNELYFDALRPLLIRFPGAAEQVRDELAKGFEIKKAELILEWANQETYNPERGRSGWGSETAYKSSPGKWHVLVRALLKPWSTDDPLTGPTFEAYIGGAGYWAKGGGRGDGTDRADVVFGPAPMFPRTDWDGEWKPKKGGKGANVDTLMDEMTREMAGDPAASNTVARLDVTRVFEDVAFGADPGARLGRVESCGFQVFKKELFDMVYRVSWSGYDWNVSTGYMKMWTKPPRLVLTLAPVKKPAAIELPPAVAVTNLAMALKQKGGGVSPMAFPANRAALAAARQARPEGMPDWMWTRLGELRSLAPSSTDNTVALGYTINFNTLLNGDDAAYADLMRKLLSIPPRHWYGHPTSDLALLVGGYLDFLPPAVQDHMRLYWHAWLHPDLEKLTAIDSYNPRVPSYFRGYSTGGGTMNFGHNACAGTLLASQFIGAEYPLRDARGGVEHLQREWGLGSGAHQEIGDTYYHAISLLTTGFIDKHATDPVDRLLGRVHRDRLIEPLASMYHPGLRRMTHPMGRGSPAYHFLLQEGPYHILHSLSPQGVLIHLDDLGTNRTGTASGWGKIHGLSILGDEVPPYRVSLLAPWTEPYLAEAMGAAVDAKKLPADVFAVDNSPGCFPGGWHVNHLGNHYSLASRDNANGDYGLTSVVGQWHRNTERVKSLDDAGTLLVAFGADGSLLPFGGNAGHFGIVQKGGKLVALKGIVQRREMADEKTPRQFRALSAMAGIFAFGDTSDREVWINGEKSAAMSGTMPAAPNWEKRYVSVLKLSEPEIEEIEDPVLIYPPLAERRLVTAKDGDVITIRDGVTFMGLIPIVVNPMKRDREVELRFEPPFLYVSAFLFRDAAPLKIDEYYGNKATSTAGFVVELADTTEYESFEAFRTHMLGVKTAVTWNGEKKAAEVVYTSGADSLEMTFDPHKYPALARKVNGVWPYVGKGVMRESSLAIQGQSGRLEKNGAVLESESNRTAYLIREPGTGTTIGYNPLPDLLAGWMLTTPEGVTVKADGKVGLLRVTVQPAQNRVAVDYAVRENQKGADMATVLTVEGLKAKPQVILNDHVVEPRLKDGTTFDVLL